MRVSPILAALLILQGVAVVSNGQTPPAPAKPAAPAAPAAPVAKNLVGNGGFETSFKRENLWDGVDASGYLTGERGSVPIITTGGVISDSSMPISVSVADMNGDGLPDIVTMDVLGYLRIYFNSGSKTEPKFTNGELGGIFLSRTAPKDPLLGGLTAPQARQAPRVFATDILHSGKKDLIIGNYLGEILLVPNAGSAQAPDFKQPADVSRLLLPTTKDSNRRWGNLFAPCTWDWDKDGKDDLLLGEGSYSANNIHLLINKGSGAKPEFDETNHVILAYGGVIDPPNIPALEQLTPTVVDYNGDGLPDLLVTERTGKIAVYLNKGGPPPKMGEPPPEVPFASYITAAGGSTPMSFGGICTVATGDFNGDGLFDLVVGKTNGRIALVLNTGSKTEPKFGPPTELKGTEGTPALAIPSAWDVDYGLKRGNFGAYVTVVKAADDKTAEPAEGQACLKAGYVAPFNKIMPAPSVFTQGYAGFDLSKPDFSGHPAEDHLYAAPARYFMIRQLNRFKFKQNGSYTFSFKAKGRFENGVAMVGWQGKKALSDAVVVQGERGSAQVKRNEVSEDGFEVIRFSGGATWMEQHKDFKVSFRNKDLQELKEATSTVVQFSFSLPTGAEGFLDDVKIIERP